jgi:hypothetical protein
MITVPQLSAASKALGSRVCHIIVGARLVAFARKVIEYQLLLPANGAPGPVGEGE